MKKLYFTDGMWWNKIHARHMMEDDPHCYWCGIEVKIHPFVIGQPYPLNHATIDHLVSRYFRAPGTIVPKVLACLECNQKRSYIEWTWWQFTIKYK